jgi:multimeric flavodoxin WrbA
MTRARIIGIVGSPRKGGNTEFLMQHALKIIGGEGFDTELIPLAGKNIGLCKGCDTCKQTGECSIQDDFQEVFARMLPAEGIILGSPVYNFTITPLMSTFKVRASRMSHTAKSLKSHDSSSALEKKVGGAVVVARRAGAVESIAELNNFFLSNEMFIVGSRYPNVAYALGRGEVVKDTEGVANIERFAHNFAWLLHSISKSQARNPK